MQNFILGFEKQAAARSEIFGSLVASPVHVAGGLIGAITGPYSAKDQEEVNKKSRSNVIPGVGGYRYGRRLVGLGLTAKERPGNKE